MVVLDDCHIVIRQKFSDQVGPHVHQKGIKVCALTGRECRDPQIWYRRPMWSGKVMCPKQPIKHELKADGTPLLSPPRRCWEDCSKLCNTGYKTRRGHTNVELAPSATEVHHERGHQTLGRTHSRMHVGEHALGGVSVVSKHPRP